MSEASVLRVSCVRRRTVLLEAIVLLRGSVVSGVQWVPASGPLMTRWAAAAYTQTTDVEIEVNGLMTYDRSVIKVDSDAVRRANETLHRSASRGAGVTQ